MTCQDSSPNSPWKFFSVFTPMSKDAENAITDLRQLIDRVTLERNSGRISEQTSTAVRKALLRLRRAHAKLRETQSETSKAVNEAIKRFNEGRLHLDNSKFVESQCKFLAEKFESTQTPELDKVSMYLPSVEEFTRQHSEDIDFVPYENDPHQFTLSMLANELLERKKLEESILSLETTRESLQSQIVKKQKFLSSMSSKLSELAKSVETVKSSFPLQSSLMDLEPPKSVHLPFASELSSTPQLLIIASKFSSVLTSNSVTINNREDDVIELRVVVHALQSSACPPNVVSLDAELKFAQKRSSADIGLSVNPKGIYPNLLEDVLDPIVSIETVVGNTRGAVAHLMWTAYEMTVLSSLKLPQITSSAWDVEPAFAGVTLSSFNHSVAGCFILNIRIGSTETELILNMLNKTLVIQRTSLMDGGNVYLVSRITDSHPDDTVIVDINLARTEEKVSLWWKSKLSEVGRYAFGELTALVMKCINSL
jgi:hypothetical protein